MEKRRWLVLNYNLPTEPSRYRVATWRGLKKLGAVNIQQSMWILPYNNENHSALEVISQDIEAKGGDALLMESICTNKKYEEKIILDFNRIRDEEYKEYMQECEKYLKELKKEISIEKFTFAELEEEEGELEKLLSWHSKIKARDIFHSSEGETAIAKREQIINAFEDYSELVYKRSQSPTT
jgi:hypothetical protein